MNYTDTVPIPDNVLTITNLLSHTINMKYTTELKLVGKRRFNVITVASRVFLFVLDKLLFLIILSCYVNPLE